MAAGQTSMKRLLQLCFFVLSLAGCRTAQIHGVLNPPATAKHFDTVTHQVVRAELEGDKDLPERLALLDTMVAESLTELDRLPAPKNEKARAKQFFKTVDRVIVCNNFIFPPEGLVDEVSDALRPTNNLSAEQIRLASHLEDNRRRRAQIQENLRRGGAFHFSDCDTTSMIYVAVAEARGWPVHLVELPGHAFVRWDSPAVKMNWDANTGASYSDASYREGAHLPDDRRRLPYLKSLNRDEMIGYWLTVLGWTHLEQERFAEATQEFAQACQLFPSDLDTRDKRAWFLATCGDPGFRNAPLAVQLSRSVVDDYGDPLFLDTLAAAYAESGDFAEAVKTEQHALETAETWERSEYESDPWPDFNEYVQTYSNRQTYAEHAAELTSPVIYTRSNLVQGVVIKAPASVDARALDAAAAIVREMLQRDDIAARLARHHFDLAIIPRHAYITVLPEFAHLKGQRDANGNAYDSFDVRGAGCVQNDPVTATSEENLLRLESDNFAGYDVTCHEFAHAIKNFAFTAAQTTQWENIYDSARRRNLFPGKFAMKNAEEYWAELSQSYFGLNDDINGAAFIRWRDPAAYKFLKSIYRPASR